MLQNMKITTDIINKLSPCKNRFQNWKSHYDSFDGNVIDFLSLDKITAKDKIWVCIRLLPRDLVETFAVDSAFAAYAAYAAAYAAADAYAYVAADAVAAYAAADAADAYAYAYAAADAADAYAAADAAAYVAADAVAAYAAADAADAYAAADAASNAERERQVDALIYLITNYKRK